GRAATVVDVTDYPDINELTLAADVAVLDYSSLRFDWAITGKPMVFFVPDLESYFGLRAPLFPFEESAPGPWARSTAEVADQRAPEDRVDGHPDGDARVPREAGRARRPLPGQRHEATRGRVGRPRYRLRRRPTTSPDRDVGSPGRRSRRQQPASRLRQQRGLR